MSLKTDRKPVEVRMWHKGEFSWIRVCRYIVHKGGSPGWLTFLSPEGDERMAAPDNWQKVKP